MPLGAGAPGGAYRSSWTAGAGTAMRSLARRPLRVPACPRWSGVVGSSSPGSSAAGSAGGEWTIPETDRLATGAVGLTSVCMGSPLPGASTVHPSPAADPTPARGSSSWPLSVGAGEITSRKACKLLRMTSQGSPSASTPPSPGPSPARPSRRMSICRLTAACVATRSCRQASWTLCACMVLLDGLGRPSAALLARSSSGSRWVQFPSNSVILADDQKPSACTASSRASCTVGIACCEAVPPQGGGMQAS